MFSPRLDGGFFVQFFQISKKSFSTEGGKFSSLIKQGEYKTEIKSPALAPAVFFGGLPLSCKIWR